MYGRLTTVLNTRHPLFKILHYGPMPLLIKVNNALGLKLLKLTL
jgi:hypothetical protein